jgi:hypothetical protein
MKSSLVQYVSLNFIKSDRLLLVCRLIFYHCIKSYGLLSVKYHYFRYFIKMCKYVTNIVGSAIHVFSTPLSLGSGEWVCIVSHM